LNELARAPFPWDAGKIAAFLEEAAARLGVLYEREVAVSHELAGAVEKL
jgi:hypothetical protein